MIADLKERWVAALRGGSYEQGRAQLRYATGDGDAYCCLGVLIDVFNPDLWEEAGSCSWGLRMYGEDDYGEETIDVEEGDLTPAVLRQVEMTIDETSALILMNDGTRCATTGINVKPGDPPEMKWVDGKNPKSFNEIADYIEANL